MAQSRDEDDKMNESDRWEKKGGENNLSETDKSREDKEVAATSLFTCRVLILWSIITAITTISLQHE